MESIKPDRCSLWPYESAKPLLRKSLGGGHMLDDPISQRCFGGANHAVVLTHGQDDELMCNVGEGGANMPSRCYGFPIDNGMKAKRRLAAKIDGFEDRASDPRRALN